MRRTTNRSICTVLASLVLALLVLTLVACSGGSSASSDDQAADDATATEAEATEAADDTASEAEATAALAGQTVPSLGSLPTGSLGEVKQLDAPEELSQAETDRVSRAIRAYTPPADSLLVNKAKTFYYQSQLKGDTKTLYDAFVELLSDPTNDEAYFSATLKSSADEKAFENDVLLAYLAVQYDHPEFFFAYNGLETDIGTFTPYDDDHTYIFALTSPYKRYKKEMTAFNEATEKFLADIDLDASDAQIAQAIHDKLIDTVTYDWDVVESQDNDLAHTAYGALVANSAGTANYAVCDGYSQAYVYLLQQAGINAAVVVGDAGVEGDTGGHAWTVVQLDGDWYEVDSTWDDQGQWDDIIAQTKKDDPNNEALPYYEKAFSDETFVSNIEHYLYNVTTTQISKYEPSDAFVYNFDDGAQLQLLEPSVHVRYSDVPGSLYETLMSYAPDATGTKYAYAIQ